MTAEKKNNSLKGKINKVADNTKEKTEKVRKSSTWQKTKDAMKKGVEITGSHLATTKASIILSNKEAELMEKLKSKLNKKGIYPSKSEILRAGLWSLRNKSEEELEEAVKDLFKVKQMRIL